MTSIDAASLGSPKVAEPAGLVSTYSIVARDPVTGDLGIAVQSHYFAVGTAVPWAEPGVGAVASQAFAEASYGPLGLGRLARGESPAETLKALLADDPGSEARQVAIVNADGLSAAHTGSRCVHAAGHRTREGYSAQGNMLRSEDCWQAMGETFEGHRGSFESRLFAALEAGEQRGGDLRGRQSAAILIVSGQRSDRPWEERRLDLRVDDHCEPLVELARLMDVNAARRAFEEAAAAFGVGKLELASERIAAAHRLQPGHVEFNFWMAVMYANSGRVEDALPLLREVYAQHAGWRDLLRRLPPTGMLPDDPVLIERLCSV